MAHCGNRFTLAARNVPLSSRLPSVQNLEKKNSNFGMETQRGGGMGWDGMGRDSCLGMVWLPFPLLCLITVSPFIRFPSLLPILSSHLLYLSLRVYCLSSLSPSGQRVIQTIPGNNTVNHLTYTSSGVYIFTWYEGLCSPPPQFRQQQQHTTLLISAAHESNRNLLLD